MHLRQLAAVPTFSLSSLTSLTVRLSPASVTLKARRRTVLSPMVSSAVCFRSFPQHFLRSSPVNSLRVKLTSLPFRSSPQHLPPPYSHPLSLHLGSNYSGLHLIHRRPHLGHSDLPSLRLQSSSHPHFLSFESLPAVRGPDPRLEGTASTYRTDMETRGIRHHVQGEGNGGGESRVSGSERGDGIREFYDSSICISTASSLE